MNTSKLMYVAKFYIGKKEVNKSEFFKEYNSRQKYLNLLIGGKNERH